MNYKYLILDFGNVIVTPTTGDWHITPKFLELIDMNKINKDLLSESIKKYSYLLSEVLITQEEEYDMFKRFYDGILSNVGYLCDKKIIDDIAYDRTYNGTKYTLCENVFEELSKLKEKYTLLMLTDNWPCVIPYLKDNNLYDFFDKVYVSSFYGVIKKDKVFFDYPINEYHIKSGEALFIDDTESLLDVGKDKGLDCMLMDRYKKTTESKYKIINDLNSL